MGDMNGFGNAEMVFFTVFAIAYLAIIGLAIAQYVLTSLSVYDMARKRGVRFAGLVWIPVVGNWVLGALLDRCEAQRGRKRRWGCLLLILNILIIVFYLLMMGVVIAGTFALARIGVAGESAVMGTLGVMAVFYVLMAMVVVVRMSCWVVCLYKVYEEMLPEKAVKYLLLSCLLPLAAGLCLMRCSKVSAACADEGPAGVETSAQEEEFIPQDPFASVEKREEE